MLKVYIIAKNSLRLLCGPFPSPTPNPYQPSLRSVRPVRPWPAEASGHRPPASCFLFLGTRPSFVATVEVHPGNVLTFSCSVHLLVFTFLVADIVYHITLIFNTNTNGWPQLNFDATHPSASLSLPCPCARG